METIQALGNTGLKYTMPYPTEQQTQESSQPLMQWVSETEYWEKYYDYPDKKYEWHNGYLEELLPSQQVTFQSYLRYLMLINAYLETNKIADLCGLGMGFRLDLPNGVSIRRPDLGLVLKNNPIPIEGHDTRYHGTFDICIEAISEFPSEIERDTVIKKAEYAAVGVKEYFILDGNKRFTSFYRLDPDRAVYVPIEPLEGDIIQSNVLPGFQFRISDYF